MKDQPVQVVIDPAFQMSVVMIGLMVLFFLYRILGVLEDFIHRHKDKPPNKTPRLEGDEWKDGYEDESV